MRGTELLMTMAQSPPLSETPPLHSTVQQRPRRRPAGWPTTIATPYPTFSSATNEACRPCPPASTPLLALPYEPSIEALGHNDWDVVEAASFHRSQLRCRNDDGRVLRLWPVRLSGSLGSGRHRRSPRPGSPPRLRQATAHLPPQSAAAPRATGFRR